MNPLKYLFAILIFLQLGVDAGAQCFSIPGAYNQQISSSDKIIEGKVVGQSPYVGQDGNIYTSNSIEVYRVLKGQVGFDLDFTTEGGVFGDKMQLVTPSVQVNVGDYGLLVLKDEAQRGVANLASTFIPINEITGSVLGRRGLENREELYDEIARFTGNSVIELRRVSLEHHESESNRQTPVIDALTPLVVTAGTKTIITITGQGFGAEQGDGKVFFSNADDGGQSFVAIQEGPHFVSWSDTEIQMYVPSSTLFNSTVAGTGHIKVQSNSGALAVCPQQLTVRYAKSEVIYSEQLNQTMLIGSQNGGYEFSINQNLINLLEGQQLAERTVEKWACNTGVNFKVGSSLTAITTASHDQVNVLGLSDPNQLPSYLLGRTVTTFSSCGSVNGLQWNMVEVDILLNSDIDWWVSESQPMSNRFDLVTSLLHELGHAHLLQHNNNQSSPMYFQLTEGAMRRELSPLNDIGGGDFIVDESVNAVFTCNDENHIAYDFNTCNLSLINSIEDEVAESMTIYPNPFQNELNISGDWQEGDSFRIIDGLGRTALNGVLQSNTQAISTESLIPGLYLFEIQSESSRSVHQLIKN